VAWEGFLFVKGVKSGGDSISKFSKKIRITQKKQSKNKH